MKLKLIIVLIIFFCISIVYYLFFYQECSIQFLLNGKPLSNEKVLFTNSIKPNHDNIITLDKDGKINFSAKSFQTTGFMFNSKTLDLVAAGNMKLWGKTVYNFDKANKKLIKTWSYNYIVYQYKEAITSEL